MSNPKIVVVTPLKNEDWILDIFLQVTSIFADMIIIADQNSTDKSREICQKYEKVFLIENPDVQYNEATRQQLLIDTARKRVPGHKIILALDCDEILSADSLSSPGWEMMLTAQPGTIIFFKKPNLFLSFDSYEECDTDFPGAFVDDGSPHNPSKIHSIRIPMPENARRLYIHDVNFLHYALLRPRAQMAKFRMYAALENINRTKSLYTRRRYYDSTRVLKPRNHIRRTPSEWFDKWGKYGIPVKCIKDDRFYWQDDMVLALLKKHGEYRFWIDDIWDIDWNALQKCEMDNEAEKIKSPPRWFQYFNRILFNFLFFLSDSRKRLTDIHRSVILFAK